MSSLVSRSGHLDRGRQVSYTGAVDEPSKCGCAESRQNPREDGPDRSFLLWWPGGPHRCKHARVTKQAPICRGLKRHDCMTGAQLSPVTKQAPMFRQGQPMVASRSAEPGRLIKQQWDIKRQAPSGWSARDCGVLEGMRWQVVRSCSARMSSHGEDWTRVRRRHCLSNTSSGEW